jgi:tetratricopeptide (TPR) repeat protein
LKSIKLQEILNSARSQYEKGEHKKAKILLDEIIDSGTSDKELLASTYFILANIFHLKGQIGKAIKAFNKVLSLEPGHTDASISLSVLYNDIGYYEEAKKIFEQANARVKSTKIDDSSLLEDQHINKKFSLKHYELAEMYFTYNRYDEALHEYNKSINLDPDFLEARIKVAKVYAKKNFINKALDELMKLKNENPTYMPARVALGILYYGSGKILDAQSEWEKVLMKEPKNQEAMMYINLSKTATETSL